MHVQKDDSCSYLTSLPGCLHFGTASSYQHTRPLSITPDDADSFSREIDRVMRCTNHYNHWKGFLPQR